MRYNETVLTQFQRALFIRFGGMGDILMVTPSIRALAQSFPGITIDFLVGGGMTEAISGHPLIRQIHMFDKRAADGKPGLLLAFLAKLRPERYDLVINLHPSAKSHLMTWVTGARHHVTFRKNMEVSAQTGRVVHAIDDFGKELIPLGIESLPDRQMDFIVSLDVQAQVLERLSGWGIAPEDRLLVINPAASRPLNRWPLARFQEVAAHFAAKPGVKVVLTGAPVVFKTVMDGLDEVTLAARVAEADTRIVNVAGQLTLKALGALLRRANAFLTCDTGPMHVASALNTPLVVLSGAADPDRTGPLTENATVLIDRSLSCVPCRDRICRRGDVLCMDNLSVSAVIAALEKYLFVRSDDHYAQRLPILS